MPEGSKIVDIRRSFEPHAAFELIVDNPDLPAVYAGERIPLVTPSLTADYEKRPSTWLAWDWNLPE